MSQLQRTLFSTFFLAAGLAAASGQAAPVQMPPQRMLVSAQGLVAPVPLAEAVPVPVCEVTLGPEDVSQLVRRIAGEEGLEQGLAEAMARVESRSGQKLVSGKGAVGIMQLMPGTGADYGVTDRCDPQQNVRAGVRYMRDLVAKYDGNIVMALGAYNAGPEKVRRADGVPLFPETAKYVVSVLNNWRDFKFLVAASDHRLTPALPTDARTPARPPIAGTAGQWIENHVINVETSE